MKKRTILPVIDLTPLVDLGFLLLMSFMVFSFYNKPRVMEMNMPDCCDCSHDYGCGYMEITRTLFLDKDSVYCNKRIYLWEKDTLQAMAYSDLRTYIVAQEMEMDKYKKQGLFRPKQNVTYLIKPLPCSRYENMVDVLDEMTICDVATYAIVDVLPQEKVRFCEK